MSILGETLTERVAGIIPRYSMVSPGDRVGVAVSGGADSVVLLHILHGLSERLQIELFVLHLNHRLRGAESDEDEEFVRRLAESLRLPVAVEHAQLGGGNLEQGARIARQEFFGRAMERHALNKVALGHTRSDQAETVLFRLLRGSGLSGLAGMRPMTRNGLIRPLLTTSRDEVRRWAATAGIDWREDSSNADLGFARNRLRQQTLPTLAEGFNPNLEGVLAGTAELAQAEEEYWFQHIEPIYRQITKRTHLGSILHIPDLRALHLAEQRRLIRRALVDVRGDLRSLDLAHVEAILGLCASEQGHDRVIVPGVDALRSYNKLLLALPRTLNSQPRHYHLELKLGEECQLPYDAGSIYVNWENTAADFCANFKEEQEFTVEVAHLSPPALRGQETVPSLCVRNWEPGDELQRPGHTGADKIKSLFQQHRVLLWERRHWPVVMSGEEIVWVRRFGSAAKFSGSGDNRQVLHLIYRPTE